MNYDPLILNTRRFPCRYVKVVREVDVAGRDEARVIEDELDEMRGELRDDTSEFHYG